MSIDLGDLSEGMGMIFMREFMETAHRLTCDEGCVLFREGDITHHFYTLIQGELRLIIGNMPGWGNFWLVQPGGWQHVQRNGNLHQTLRDA